MPAQSAEPSTDAQLRAISPKLLGVILLAAVAIAVVALVFVRPGGSRPAHALALPDSIGRVPLVGDAASGAKQALTAEGWLEVAAGGYGNGAGQVLLIVGRPAASVTDQTSFLHSLQGPLVQQGFVFNAATATRTAADGTDFVCGPVSAASGQLNLCTWNDGDAAGILIDYSGATLAQAQAQAQVARTAAEH